MTAFKWFRNHGPEVRYFWPTVKKKISTIKRLFSEKKYNLFFKAIWFHIYQILWGTNFHDIVFMPKYLSKYYNIPKEEFDINVNLNFNEEDEFFKNKLLNSKLYLEYGAGSSTLLADRNNIPFYSLENNKNFYNALKPKLKNKNNLFLVNFGVVSSGSQPVLFSYRKFFLKNRANYYAKNILDTLSSKGLVPDLILIDGRYRVLCALHVYKFLKKMNLSSTIIIDDYYRPYLKVAENFFIGDVVGRFGVFNGIKDYDKIDELIETYSYDYR